MLNFQQQDARRSGRAHRQGGRSSPAKDIEKNVKAMLQSGLVAARRRHARTSSTCRREVLAKTREKLEQLEARVAELEARRAAARRSLARSRPNGRERASRRPAAFAHAASAHVRRGRAQPRACGRRRARRHGRGAPRRRPARHPSRRACPTPRCARRATACAPRCRTRSSKFPRARSPSTSRRRTCRRSRAASTCRSRSASSPRPGRFPRDGARRATSSPASSR